MRYEPLPTGTHGLTPDAVARDQRERLQRAILELIAAKGYPAVRIADLARLSRVSQPTFYSLFEGKEELLLSAYTDIAARTRSLVADAFAEPGDWRDRLLAAILRFADLAAAEPEAVSLLVLGALGAGPRALQERRRLTDVLEQLVGELRGGDTTATGSAGGVGEGGADMTTTVIVGGIREVAGSRLFHGRQAELSLIAQDLVGWAGTYPVALPDGLAVPAPRSSELGNAVSGPPPMSARARSADRRLPRGRNRLPRRVVRDSQRERIVDATAAIVAERGLGGLTVPEIARRAGVSHQTFYAIYRSKQDAYLGAQKVGLHQALQIAGGAWQARMPDWPGAIAGGLRALVDYLVSEPQHAHLTIVDTFGASPQTIQIRERTLKGFSAFFAPRHRGGPALDGFAAEGADGADGARGARTPAGASADGGAFAGGAPDGQPGSSADADGASAGSAEPRPSIAVEAVVGGCWQVLHRYVESGRLAELPRAVPQLTYLLLTPFVGSEQAARTAEEASSDGASASTTPPGGSELGAETQAIS
jgi:AcrR family transcriptional regulator